MELLLPSVGLKSRNFLEDGFLSMLGADGRRGGDTRAAIAALLGVTVSRNRKPTIDQSYFSHILKRGQPFSKRPVLMISNQALASDPILTSVQDILERTPIRGIQFHSEQCIKEILIGVSVWSEQQEDIHDAVILDFRQCAFFKDIKEDLSKILGSAIDAGKIVLLKPGEAPSREEATADALDIENVDQWVHGNKIIHLGAFSLNDARFFKPEDRAMLVLRPDVSLFHGAVYVKKPISRLFSEYANVEFYRDFHLILKRELDGLTEEDIEDKTENAIIELCEERLKRKITKAVVRPSMYRAIVVAGFLFSLGLLFPFLFPIFTTLALGLMLLGCTTTLIATWWNRRKVEQCVRAHVQEEEIKNHLKKIIKRTSSLSSEKKEEQKKANVFTDILRSLVEPSLVAEVAAYMKYGISTPLVNAIPAMAPWLIWIMEGIGDSITQVRERISWVWNLSSLARSSLMPNLKEEDLLDYMKDPAHHKTLKRIFQGVELDFMKNSEQALQQLKRDRRTFVLLQVACSRKLLESSLKDFCKKRSWDFDSAKKDEAFLGDIVHAYILESVQNKVYRRSVKSGLINSGKIALSVIGIGALFPPATIFMVVAGLFMFFLGVLLTFNAARIERKYFAKAVARMFERADFHEVSHKSLKKYIRKNKREVVLKLHMEGDVSVNLLLEQLYRPENKNYLFELKNKCYAAKLVRRVHKWNGGHFVPINIEELQQNPQAMEAFMHQYHAFKGEGELKNNIRRFGFILIAALTASLVLAAFIFPPAGLGLLIAAAGVFLLGMLVTELKVRWSKKMVPARLPAEEINRRETTETMMLIKDAQLQEMLQVCQHTKLLIELLMVPSDTVPTHLLQEEQEVSPSFKLKRELQARLVIRSKEQVSVLSPQESKKDTGLPRAR